MTAKEALMDIQGTTETDWGLDFEDDDRYPMEHQLFSEDDERFNIIYQALNELDKLLENKADITRYFDLALKRDSKWSAGISEEEQREMVKLSYKILAAFKVESTL